MVSKTKVDGDDGYDNCDPSDHKVADYSNPSLVEVPDDISEEGTNDNGNVNMSSVENLN
ncbi:hypothetical protein PVK06_011732 [Gossypium arboreum]|uniref:Uncharacterized protein n=1 Tax=Gossypium arboreum TaxID=29729 RepID=A0ABR0QA97_GOSAR|nr:hypothetical protein PVK06_011732 [Gossypium arboreum]